MKNVNSKLAKKYGKPANASEGDITKYGGGSGMSKPSKNSSIMSNPNTKSDRCGYGVNGV